MAAFVVSASNALLVMGSSAVAAVDMNSLRPRMRVRNVRTGEEGTVGPQSQFFPEDGPVRVAVDGHSLSYIETDDKFVIIGEETPVPHHEKCGRNKEACIFAAVGPGGMQCLRYTDLHESMEWNKNKMRAQREPTLPWPKCLVSQ